jgi:dipeptidyl-peptidase-4
MSASRFTLLLVSFISLLLNAEDMLPAYERAVKHLPAQAAKLIRNATIDPLWMKGQDKFVYRRQLTAEAKEFVLVDAVANTSGPAFDHGRLAASLTAASRERVDPTKLPFDRVEISDEELRFTWKKEPWTCILPGYECARKPAPERDEVASSDGNWIAFLRGPNLWLRSSKDGRERPLTTDGEPYFAYAATTEGINTITDRREGRKRPPQVLWSPDSHRLLTFQLDERNVESMHLIQSVPESRWPSGGPRRPVLHSYRYALPGDANVPLMQLIVFGIDTGAVRRLQTPRLVQFLPERLSPNGIFASKRVIWSPDSSTIFATEISRDQKTINLWSADASTGDSRLLIEEKTTTYLESLVPMTLLPKRKQLLWWSERSGWGHLYLYSYAGMLVRPLTTGDWLVRSLLSTDEERGRIVISVSGRAPYTDPYLQRLYGVDLERAALIPLADEDANHGVLPAAGEQRFSPSGTFFIDRYSRVDQAPLIVLRDRDGKIVREIERADTSAYDALKAPTPRVFKAKARDGKTDLYGTIHLPSTFDPRRKYPVLDSEYPGPQVIKVPKEYQSGSSEQAIAELGFAVVQIDGLGKPFRSKAIHDAAYANLGDTGGLEDHVAVLRQLVKQHPYLDLDRVGIYGHSGGGFGSARGLLLFPDFYKVAVSSAGNHDQLGYFFGWGEKYQGMVNGRNYDNQDTSLLAANLRGKLLLAWGDMDDNVHPSLTIRLIDALIKANKTFDLLVMPNRNHSFSSDPYFNRRRWDYFVEHLLGEKPPAGFVIPKVIDLPEQ